MSWRFKGHSDKRPHSGDRKCVGGENHCLRIVIICVEVDNSLSDGRKVPEINNRTTLQF